MLEQVRQYLRVPFRPFELHLSSGEVYRVEHPENAAIVAHQVIVALPDGENAIMIGPLDITGVSGVQSVSA